MPEEEADELFEQIASNATFLSGHTTFRQLLAAGEYSLVASDYSYGIDAAADEGAPVAWEPPVEPLFARANGIGLANGAPNPAGALLLSEWLLSDGQDILLENFITPARADLLDTGDADVRTIDVAEYLAEQGGVDPALRTAPAVRRGGRGLIPGFTLPGDGRSGAAVAPAGWWLTRRVPWPVGVGHGCGGCGWRGSRRCWWC
jgi:hypothetical protein